VGVVAQQWIEPNQAPARFMQPVHLLAEAGSGIAVEPVADEEEDGALAENPAGPVAVELRQALADPRAARPVLDRPRHLVERDIDILVAQMARDVGKARAEEKGVDAVAVV